MKKFDTEPEIEITLSSLDKIEQAKAPPNFIDSLTRKIIFRKDQLIWIERAKYALIAVVVLAILNTFLLISDNTDNRTDLIDSVATEWNLNPSF